MSLNIIPDLLSIKSSEKNINGFYLSGDFNFYPEIHNRNVFHYEISINNNIKIPDNYDFRNGHYYKKGDKWFYKRKILFLTLKFVYDSRQKKFSFNKLYSFVPFEIGHIFPVGRHIADIINLELFINGYIVIRGSAARFKGKNIAFIAPSYAGKSSVIKSIMKKGGIYIAEEFFVLKLNTKEVFPSSYLIRNERTKQIFTSIDNQQVIKKKVKLDQLILFLNTNNDYKFINKDVFEFIILRSLIFLNNYFVKSYFFTENLTSIVFEIINKLKKIKVNYKFLQIRSFNFDKLIENDK